MTESVGNETIENTGDFCLVIGTDHALTEFFNEITLKTFLVMQVMFILLQKLTFVGKF
jgi:hypothetical protein